jgi:hypothetical protein
MIRRFREVDAVFHVDAVEYKVGQTQYCLKWRAMALQEDTVARFLRGAAIGDQLEAEIASALERVSATRERVEIADMQTELVVTSDMLVAICDAATMSAISPASVRIVAFAIIASDHFTWTEDIVGEVLHDWAAPEVHLVLSVENFQRFKRWLTGAEAYDQARTAVADETELRRPVFAELEKVASRATVDGDVIARVCTMAERYYRGEAAQQELAFESGFLLHRKRVTVDAVRRWLRTHPDTIQWWERWSEDKRTASGWYFVRRPLFSECGWYETPRGKRHVRHFMSASAACAYFVVREITELTGAK